MKAFKYFIFLFICFISSFSNAVTIYTVGNSSASTMQKACSNHFPGGIVSQATAANGSTYYRCYNSSESNWLQIVQSEAACKSGLSNDLKVSVDSGSYVCSSGCQYRLKACVDVDFEPGMTCSAISTGKDCGTTPTPTDDPNALPQATPDPSDPNNSLKNTAKSESTGTSTSTSTSTSSTSNNTTTTNTTTTTNNTTITNTIINLDRLEQVIKNMTSVISNKLDDIKNALGGNTGTPDGNGTDLTETNSKLDDIKKNGEKTNNWLQGKNEDGTGGGVGDNPFGTDTTPERELSAQTFSTNIFSGSASCPADRTLSMTLFTGKTFSTTFSYSMWCEKLSVFGYFILIASYLYGALIIVRNS